MQLTKQCLIYDQRKEPRLLQTIMELAVPVIGNVPGVQKQLGSCRGLGWERPVGVWMWTSVWSNDSVLTVGGQLCKYEAIKPHGTQC